MRCRRFDGRSEEVVDRHGVALVTSSPSPEHVLAQLFGVVEQNSAALRCVLRRDPQVARVVPILRKRRARAIIDLAVAVVILEVQHLDGPRVDRRITIVAVEVVNPPGLQTPTPSE